jgi:serine/threonine-protein kinase RsbW
MTKDANEEAPMDATTSHLHLQFPARPEYLVLGRLVLTGLSRAQAMEDDTLSDLKLALTEACSNSVRHAYEGSPPGAVDVNYELGDGYVAVQIEDEGPGFDPDSSGKAFDADALDEGGLGLAIIRAVSDECEVRPRRDGHGSCVRFVRRLP